VTRAAWKLPSCLLAAALIGCQAVGHRHATAPAPQSSDLETALAAHPGDDHRTSAYQRALTRLVNDALRTGRLHPQHGLTVDTTSGAVRIPVRYVGLTWYPEEVAELHATGEVRVKEFLKHHHTRPGWGVPLVGVSRDAGLRGDAGRFSSAPRPITLTAVLQPGPVLELHDATHGERVHLGGCDRPLAADLSAPLAYAGLVAKQAGDERYLSQFLRPGVDPNYDQLVGLEPYRPGTLPVVFVHGAKSDNVTWLDTLNDLRADPAFTRQFQVMSFRYATGSAYLLAAANLREQGERFVRASDPAGTDPAVRAWAMIGYSLGGPVTRLAVSSSAGDTLWRAFACKPFDQMVLTDDVREGLRRRFFFEPLPYVKTAVLIAGPFDGGTVLSDGLFRLGSRLIRFPAETERQYQQIQQDNPGAIRREARGRIPTSLDLLRSNNWLSDAMRELPFGDGVRVHTIIGNGMPLGRSDRVVPVASARVPGAASETVIKMMHKDCQKHPASVRRQREILDEHAERFGMPR
jgi:hypothetical protein